MRGDKRLSHQRSQSEFAVCFPERMARLKPYKRAVTECTSTDWCIREPVSRCATPKCASASRNTWPWEVTLQESTQLGVSDPLDGRWATINPFQGGRSRPETSR